MITFFQIQQRIIEVIKHSEISQTELANRLGVKQQTIACYLSGKAMPALDTFANLCKVLDLDANDILCIDD